MLASLLSLMVWMTIAYFVLRKRPVPIKSVDVTPLVANVMPTVGARLRRYSGSNVIPFPKGGRKCTW